MDYGITANIPGLKCDNPSCDYADMTIKLENYESYIDAPCPKCGSSLLTREDYEQVQTILKVMELVSGMGLSGADAGEKAKVTFELNGTGEVDMKIEPIKDEG